jgi:TetR/AcrR family transcriptional repressor of nem operon
VQNLAEQTDTRSAILDSAERLVQSRGFNGFSYADVAAELGITKAALHYHFPGKAELGQALIVRYATRFCDSLTMIDSGTASAALRLRAYADIYLEVFRDNRMCLCGMLAAEYQTLPEPMRQAVVGFFDDNHAWLTRLLNTGRDDGTVAFAGTADQVARMVLSALEGAMLVARPYGDIRRFEAVADRLIAELTDRNATTGIHKRP